MHAHWKAVIYRSFNLLLLLVMVFTPAASVPVQASPPTQSDAPESVQAPGDHLVTNLNLLPDSPNIIRTNQNVTVNFSYSTTEPSGVRIFIRPFTNGAATPGYAAHSSPLYPTSATGQGSGWFTVSSGTREVDEIHIQMFNANQTVLLFEAFVPVYYLFSDSSNIVTDFDFIPDTPDALRFNQNVDFTFNYILRESNVQIFVRPFTNGALTPNYAAHGSPLYSGNGHSSGFFTITEGRVLVDQVRVQILNSTQTTVLFEAFLPVYFRYRGAANMVTHIELSPDSPNIFRYNQNANLSFNYVTDQPDGVYIWARPITGSGLSPDYSAHSSPLYPAGSGSGTGSFTLSSGPLVVDKVRIQMWNAAQTRLLFEVFLPVHLLWAGAGPPPGPDMSLNAVEVTQAIQDFNNSVDLVAGKRTYVRVHASSPVNIANVSATLTGKRGFVTLSPTLSPGNPLGSITVLTNPDRGQLNQSFWFELPSSWTAAGNLTLTARIDPYNAKNDLALANNTRTITVNFKATPAMRLRIFNVQYTVGSNTYLAANSHMNALESWLQRAYPISSLQVTRQTFVYPEAGLPNVNTLNGWLAFGKLIRLIFMGEDSRIVYYGLVDDGGGFMRGKAAGIPGTIASGPTGSGSGSWDTDGSYGDWYGGHEIGHTRGRYHAEFCGAADGVSYPYPNGRISPDLTGNGAIYGFDITTRAIYPPSWTDVMTYCNNEWISDYTYEGIRSYIVSIGTQEVEPVSVTAAQFLAVMGIADLDTNTVNLESVYLIDHENTLPLPESGEWEIVLLDGSDAVVASYSFSPDVLTDAEESPGTPAVIAEVIPWTPGAVTVEIRLNGETVASRSASANPPGISLNTPTEGTELPEGPFTVSWTGTDPDGDALKYSLMYSRDGGVSWETIAADLTATELELHTDQLPGGSAILRVLVTDGFLTGQATSGVFTVPLHAPSAEILTPGHREFFFPSQPVTLLGSAYDLEDGSLGDSAYFWSSNIDGDLGTGQSLIVSDLSTGDHVITLQVSDSDGMSTQVERSIRITDSTTPFEFYLPITGR